MKNSKIDLLEKKIEELAVKAKQLKTENEKLRAPSAPFEKEEVTKRIANILKKIEELNL